MKTRALVSTTLTCSPSVSGHFSHCWVSLCTSCRLIQLLSLYPFIQFLICTRIPCRDSHCENGSFEVLSLHDVWAPEFCPACHEQLFICECIGVNFMDYQQQEEINTGRVDVDDATARRTDTRQ